MRGPAAMRVPCCVGVMRSKSCQCMGMACKGEGACEFALLEEVYMGASILSLLERELRLVVLFERAACA